MATQEPTTVNPEVEAAAEIAPALKPSGKSTNPLEIVWPLDEYGFTSMLRKEGVRAVGRIRGDDAKLAVFKATLRCLLEHAGVRVADQKVVIEADLAEIISRDEAVYARNEADKAAEVARLEKLLASAKAELAAKVEVTE